MVRFNVCNLPLVITIVKTLSYMYVRNIQLNSSGIASTLLITPKTDKA